MNKNLKKMILVGMVAAAAVGFASCGSAKNNNKEEGSKPSVEVKDKEEKASEEAKYNEELAKYLPAKEGMVSTFSGSLEFMMRSTVSKVEEEAGAKTVTVKNLYEGEEGTTEPKEETDETKYVVTSDEIKISYPNSLYKMPLIKEMTLFKGELVKDGEFSHKVVIKEKEYDAVSKITNIAKDEKERATVTFEVTVQGLEEYKESPYTEKITLTEGLGITNFQCEFSVGEGNMLPFSYNIWEK